MYAKLDDGEHRAARPQDPHLRPRLRDARLHPGQAVPQDGLPLVPDRRTVLRRRARSSRTGCSARPRSMTAATAATARSPASSPSAPGSRRWRSGSSRSASTSASATPRSGCSSAVRSPTTSSIQLKLAQDGDRPGQRAEHGVHGRSRWPRDGKQADAGRGVGDEGLLLAGGDRGGDGGGAAVRRQRLHVRVPGRATRPRRQVVDDLRRQQRGADHPRGQGPARAAERSARAAGGTCGAITARTSSSGGKIARSRSRGPPPARVALARRAGARPR